MSISSWIGFGSCEVQRLTRALALRIISLWLSGRVLFGLHNYVHVSYLSGCIWVFVFRRNPVASVLNHRLTTAHVGSLCCALTGVVDPGLFHRGWLVANILLAIFILYTDCFIAEVGLFKLKPYPTISDEIGGGGVTTQSCLSGSTSV